MIWLRQGLGMTGRWYWFSNQSTVGKERLWKPLFPIPLCCPQRACGI